MYERLLNIWRLSTRKPPFGPDRQKAGWHRVERRVASVRSVDGY
jgi:hypothetical protein